MHPNKIKNWLLSVPHLLWEWAIDSSPDMDYFGQFSPHELAFGLFRGKGSFYLHDIKDLTHSNSWLPNFGSPCYCYFIHAPDVQNMREELLSAPHWQKNMGCCLHFPDDLVNGSFLNIFEFQ